MKGEIDRDFYCSANFLMIDGSKCKREICGIDGCCEDYCPHLHRKYPTPSEYKEEYGEEWPDDGAVYYTDGDGWNITAYEEISELNPAIFPNSFIVCACTPFGAPDNDWRPA